MSHWLNRSHCALQKSADFAATRASAEPDSPSSAMSLSTWQAAMEGRSKPSKRYFVMVSKRSSRELGSCFKKSTAALDFLEQAPNARGVEIIAALSESALGERARLCAPTE